MTITAHATDHQPLPPGQLRAGARGADRDRPAGDRDAARPPRRALPAHRSQPAARPGRSTTTGSSATAWCTACACATGRRSGTATAGCAPPPSPPSWASRCAARPGGPTSPPTPTSSRTPGRTLALVEAGSPPYELTEELDTVGPCDFDGTLPRVTAGRLHRPPARGPRDRRAARGLLQLDARQPGGLHGARHRRADPAQRRRQGRRQPDDARLRPHRELRRALDLPVVFDIADGQVECRALARPLVAR